MNANEGTRDSFTLLFGTLLLTQHCSSKLLSLSCFPILCSLIIIPHHGQLGPVMQNELEAQRVTVLTERLSFTPGADDTRDIVQQLNVCAMSKASELIFFYLTLCL